MSNWNALPWDALWYGEVIIARENESDYNYAYSMDTEEPDPRDIPVPDGWAIVDSSVVPAYMLPTMGPE